MKKLVLALTLLMMPIVAAMPANAELRVDITRGTLEPMPIAVSPFNPEVQGQAATYAAQIPKVIAADLAGSGLFKPINARAFVQDPNSLHNAGPRFGEWRAIGAQALISGAVTQTADGRARVEFRLWDVFGQSQLIGKAYMTNDQNWRRIAHMISDEIYMRLTGEAGYFDSRIVYVAENGPPTKRVKRLAIMDQDGFNHKYLTNGAEMVLTPRFSPNQQKLAYMAFGSRGPNVYLYEINTGRHELIGNFPGMTFAPRFSPDGQSVIFSMAKGGNTDIYTMSLASRQPRRITSSSSIDTSPSFSPDGRRIVFESDRGGSQQLYTMNSDGSGVQRITFGNGRYANPVWSPRGDLIAFTRMYKGKFYIGVIRPDGKGERLITTAYHVEGPSWSPNGRVLTYFKENPIAGGMQRQARVYTIDITGNNERWLRTPVDGSDPAWSPLNP